MIDQACADISDPAEVFAVSLRISGRLGWTHPDIARFLTGVGLESLDASRGLAPRALRDIQAGQAAGCFTVTDAQIALSAVAGGLLGLLRSRERHPERVDESIRGSAHRSLPAAARRPRFRSRPPRRVLPAPCQGSQPVISIWPTTAMTVTASSIRSEARS